MAARHQLRLWRDLTAALAEQAVTREHLASFAPGNEYQTAIHRSAELIAGLVTVPRTVSLALTFPVDVKELIEGALGVTYSERMFDEEFGVLTRTIRGSRGRSGVVTRRCTIVRLVCAFYSCGAVNKWLSYRGLEVAPCEWMLALHCKYPKLRHGPYALPTRFKSGRRNEWRMGYDASHVGWHRERGEKYFTPASDPCWGPESLILAMPRET